MSYTPLTGQVTPPPTNHEHGGGAWIEVIIGPLIEGSLEGAARVSDIIQNLRRFATPQARRPTRFDLMQVVASAVQWVINASRRKPEVHTDPPEWLALFYTCSTTPIYRGRRFRAPRRVGRARAYRSPAARRIAAQPGFAYASP